MVGFDRHIHSGTTAPSKVKTIYTFPTGFFVSPCQAGFPPFHPRESPDLLLVTVDSVFSSVSHKWNHSICCVPSPCTLLVSALHTHPHPCPRPPIYLTHLFCPCFLPSGLPTETSAACLCFLELQYQVSFNFPVL